MKKPSSAQLQFVKMTSQRAVDPDDAVADGHHKSTLVACERNGWVQRRYSEYTNGAYRFVISASGLGLLAAYGASPCACLSSHQLVAVKEFLTIFAGILPKKSSSDANRKKSQDDLHSTAGVESVGTTRRTILASTWHSRFGPINFTRIALFSTRMDQRVSCVEIFTTA